MRDIHLHLSGATDPATLWELVVESGYKIQTKSYQEFEKSLQLVGAGSLDNYLEILHVIDRVQSSPFAVKKSAFEAYKNSFLNGCSYLELRFNPTKRSQDGTIDLDKLIVAARAGYERAKSIFGIEGGLTLCLGWDCSDEANFGTFKKAIEFNGKGVVGLDIAGDYKRATEAQRDAFRGYFDKAKEAGLITTCHAGEIDHPGLEEELDWMINLLQPMRIGHGIKLAKYPELLKYAVNFGMTFEVCMSSNVASGAVTSYKEFNEIFESFEKAGAKWELCTDATSPLKTSINREHTIFKMLKDKVPGFVDIKS